MPPPEPRSRTVSPGRRSASAVGLPQPRDAATASFGRSATSWPAYRLDVITSPPPSSVPQPQALPQQPPSPAEARRAAFAYFSRTTNLMSAVSAISASPRPTMSMMRACRPPPGALPAVRRPPHPGDLFRVDRAASRAALGVQKSQQLSKRLGSRGVAEERPFPPHGHQSLVPELFEMVRQRGRRNVELGLDLAGHETVRMRREEKPQNAEPRLRPDRGEHVRVPGDVLDPGPRPRFAHRPRTPCEVAITFVFPI